MNSLHYGSAAEDFFLWREKITRIEITKSFTARTW